jgi:hypothetical protein
MNRNIEINGNMDLGAYSPLELTEGDVNESLKEKAVSKAQQRFMGMVHAVQKGDLNPDEVGSSVAKAAKTMKKKDVKDFAKTKHKGLPNHVDESTLRKIIKNVLKEIYEVNNQEKLNELSNDTIDNAYIKVMNDVNTLPYGTPKRVRRDAQLQNIKKLRNDKLGFDPVDMSIRMRQGGTSGNPSIDRKWATWQKNHDDRISGRRTYDDKTGRWTTRLTENDLRKIIQETVQTHLVDVLGKYTQGKATSEQANKAIMNLANSSNSKVNESLDDEMKQWEERDRSQFGQILKQIHCIAQDGLIDAGEAISWIRADYALDGNEERTIRKIKNSLEEYDFILVNEDGSINVEESNSPEAAQLVNQLIELSGQQQMQQVNERNNRSFYDYADEYMKKNGKKLPDEILKNAAKKNDERFFNRKK